MFVEQYGDGPLSCFCLHGWSGDHRSFEPLASHMPPHVRIYSADLPGCGQSPAPSQWTLAEVTRQVIGSLERSEPRGSVLVGNCIGALLALCVALERPDLVDRLVLIDAFARWPWYFRVFTNPVFGQHAYNLTFANPIGRWITNQSLAHKRTGHSNLTHGFAAAGHDTQLQYLRILGEIESPEQFAPVSAPVDLITAARTFRAARESAAVWQAIWPAARLFEVPDGGHLVLSESPLRVSEIIVGKHAQYIYESH